MKLLLFVSVIAILLCLGVLVGAVLAGRGKGGGPDDRR